MGVGGREVNVQAGKKGFQPVDKGKHVPTAAKPVAQKVSQPNKDRFERQGQMLQAQMQQVALRRATDRLLGGNDLDPTSSGTVLPTPHDEEELVEGARLAKGHPTGGDGEFQAPYGEGKMVAHSTSAGRIVWIQDAAGDGRHVVGVVQEPSKDYRDVLVTVSTRNEQEAKRLYSGAVASAQDPYVPHS